jgi:hypothetical protein
MSTDILRTAEYIEERNYDIIDIRDYYNHY